MTGFKRQKIEISALHHCNLSKLPIVVRRTVLEFGPHHRTRWGKVMLELVRRRCQCNWCADDIFLAFDEDNLVQYGQYVGKYLCMGCIMKCGVCGLRQFAHDTGVSPPPHFLDTCNHCGFWCYGCEYHHLKAQIERCKKCCCFFGNNCRQLHDNICPQRRQQAIYEEY